jgi:hypothetical protein
MEMGRVRHNRTRMLRYIDLFPLLDNACWDSFSGALLPLRPEVRMEKHPPHFL